MSLLYQRRRKKELLSLNIDEFYGEPFMKLASSHLMLYASLVVMLFILYGQNKFFIGLHAIGKMTLTNYLLVSAFLITLLYGIGFGMLGRLPMHTIWLYAAGWLMIEILFSTYWFRKFRYGPVEWIWRRLTYRKRIPLRR